jgi:uncharacterized OB-fold protein
MSLSETVLEGTECAKCGADVRPDTQFCYNCGGPVQENVTDGDASTNGAVTETVDEKIPAPGLRSAREIKRRERVFERRTKEVIWEPVLTTPNTQLIVVAAIVILFTVAMIVLAFYLR